MNININDIIGFKSKAINDNNYYNGKVLSICNFDLAKNYSDLLAYGNNVITSDASIPSPEECTYVIIEKEDGKGIISFAQEWMNNLIIITSYKKIDITVYNLADVEIDGVYSTLYNALLSSYPDKNYAMTLNKTY